MNNYENAMNIMSEWFGKDSLITIATTNGILIKDHHAVRYQFDFTSKSALLNENWGSSNNAEPYQANTEDIAETGNPRRNIITV